MKSMVGYEGFISGTVWRILLLMTLLPALGRASQGDQSAIYQSCLVGCRRGGLPNGGVEDVARGVSESPFCARGDDSGHRLSRLDEFILRRIMRWGCESDCRYKCMWEIEGDKRRQGTADDQDKTVYKYHGKWPFVRILGMQEPASVVLSLLNLGANVNCILLLRKYVWSMEPATGVERMGFSHRFLWYGHFILASNAWIWSAVFHSRDTAMTERLDYFSAGAVMIFDAYLSFSRAFSDLLQTSQTSRMLFAAGLILFYLRHMYMMHYVKFDYGYHVGLCVAAGVLQSLVWIGWAMFSKHGKQHPGRKYLLLFVACVNAAVLLEILDFPPIVDLLDAHALWHLATVPLVYCFFEFVKRDVGGFHVVGKQK